MLLVTRDTVLQTREIVAACALRKLTVIWIQASDKILSECALRRRHLKDKKKI